MFFESIAKKLPTSMDDLFKRDDKYAMLEYDVWIASWLDFGYESTNKKNNKAISSKSSNNQSKQGERKQDGRQQQQPLRLTLLIVSYEHLLLLIQELPKFKWLESIKIDSARQDRKLRCSHHKEHGHTMEQCKNLD